MASSTTNIWAKPLISHPLSFPWHPKKSSLKRTKNVTIIHSSLNSPSVIHLPKQQTYQNVKPGPEWTFLQRGAAMALDIAESALLSREIQHPLPKTTDPSIQIAGNFAPVPEQSVKMGKSELLIVNAMNLELEASVKLPSRVPYGFHGTFVDAKALVNQA